MDVSRKHQSAASPMCSDRESTPWPFGLQGDAPTTEPHRQGMGDFFLS